VPTPPFTNAVEYSERHPNFEVLPHSGRASRQPGDVAKICIRLKGAANFSGARFWVLIKTSNAGVYPSAH
jgi:hypothetical protein